MTPKFPTVSARDMLKALQRAGFYIHRQSGSHVILKRDRDKKRVTVPVHPGDLHIGVTRSILQQAGMSVEELSRFL